VFHKFTQLFTPTATLFCSPAWSHRAVFEKIKYIYDNPVDEGLIFRPEQNVYNSATDYSGEKGMIDGVIVVK